MGLDISFSKAKAIEAGMVLTIERRGTDSEIAEYKASTASDDDPDYLKYLVGSYVHARIFLGIGLGNKSFEVDGYANDTLFVRANKWGNLYAPLTAWLSANQISWIES